MRLDIRQLARRKRLLNEFDIQMDATSEEIEEVDIREL